MLLLLLVACIRNEGFPEVGDCAAYPEGSYTWGEIGIGTCLAGPNTLAFAGDPASPTLLVVNANPYLTFTGGSLLALPWDALDLDEGRVLVSSLEGAAVDVPHFPIGLDINEDGLGMVPVRLSEEARTRAWYDDVWLFDLSDPSAPALSDRGTDGGHEVTVQSDPVAVSVDSLTGFAYVANRTSHSVSILDLTGDEVEAVAPWPDQALRIGPFSDEDGSGSRAELASLEVDEDELLTDDVWTFSWVEGTWRIWVPADGGLQRFSTTGQTYQEGGLGTELYSEDYDGEITLARDPAFFLYGDTLRMFFEDEGVIRAADIGDYLGEWVLDTEPSLEGDADAWDATMGGPSVTLDEDANIWMFYDGTDGESWAIGAATSSDAVSFRRAGAAVLEPAWPHEAERISDPHVLRDVAADQYRMYYSAYDGETWTIGHATSPDLGAWTSDEEPVFAVDGVDVAAPVLSQQDGQLRMWYARREAATWSLGAAISLDGYTWTDLGTVAELEHSPSVGDEPPGPTVYSTVADLFAGVGADAGSLAATMTPGIDYTTEAHGWTARALAGFHLSPFDVGAAAYGGVSLDSLDEDTGLGWLSLTSRDGDLSIGALTVDADGRLLPLREPVLEAGEEGFDADGVSSPVVWATGEGYAMLYAGLEGAVSTIGLATSDDGLVWTRQGQVMDVDSEAWDGSGIVPGSVQVLDDGSLRLWYTGSNGEIQRIGSAVSVDDGLSWTREEAEQTRPWAFPPGSPGDWDDSGVRDPYIVTTEEGQHLYYAGSDGDLWRIGHAFRATDDDEWLRAEDPVTADPRPVFGVTNGLFHPDGVRRPLARYDGEAWSLYFAGLDGVVARVGMAGGKDPERLHELAKRPTLGDTLSFATEKGDDEALAITLDSAVEGRSVSGEALNATLLDEERGMLYVTSSHTNYVFVLDVRDDSEDGAPDENYLDIEAILLFESSDGGAGFHALAMDGDRLFALNDAPESLVIFDLGALEDDAYADVVYESVLSSIPLPLGSGGDEGVDTVATFGPGSLAIHPDGRRVFVTNFNDNSVTVIDLTLGTAGAIIEEVSGVGENPYAITLSPDGMHAVVANYTGEVNEEHETASTLAVLDLDEDSSTYLEVLSWVVNR